MSSDHTSKGFQVSKHSARKNTVLALAFLLTGTGGVAAAQEGPAAAPAATQQAAPPAPTAAPQEEAPAAAPAQPEAPKPAQQPAAAAPPAPKPQPAARPALKQPAPEEMPVEEYVEEIVVTGSRIPRKELTTAAPVTVLDKEQLEKTGKTSIGEILQSIPEQSNAINTQYNNGGDGATRVNLRGLGTERTLVLLNGRRHVAGGTGADATVDLNSIPTAAIQRIEILKDGGSAVYGSDAIAGVVNIITRTDYSGTELRAFSGVSSRGDGLLYDLSLTTGQSTERGNILFTAGSTSIPQGVFYKRGATGGNGVWNDLVAQYPSASNFTIDPKTGEFRPFKGVGVTDAGGDLYNYQPENYLVTPQQRAHVYSTGGLRLGSGARAFYEASFTNRLSAQQLASEPLFTATEGLAVKAANLYNPFGRDFPDVRRRLTEFGTRDRAQDINTFRVVTGLEGKLSEDFGGLKDWHWDVAYNHGRTQSIETKKGTLRRSLLAAAIGPSFINPATGQAVCGTPEAPVADCVPLNLFGGEGSITPEMANYLSFEGTARGLTSQTSISANFGGELFQLMPGARASGLAVGYEHRREVGAFVPDPLTASGDTTGNKGSSTKGSYYVNEGFLELSVPILGERNAETGELRDVWEVTGAARAFNYSTFGSDLTYKFGTRVSVIPDVTIRATFSTAFRAPSVSELYAGQTDSFLAVVDPCSDREQGTRVDELCDAEGLPDDLSDGNTQLRTRLGGNPALQPETAKIFTVGVVLEPRMLKDVTATVDFYAINIDDAITNVTPSIILNSCYPDEAGVTPQYCDRIHRDAFGLINSISDPLSNVGGDKTGGLDLSLRYRPQTPYGSFTFSADATWLQKFDRTLADGKVVKARNTYDLTQVYTDWKANLGVGWTQEGLSASANMRFINGFKECEANSCFVEDPEAPEPLSRMVHDYYTFDASVAYDWQMRIGSASAQLGVNNLFDAQPAQVFNGFLASSDASTYDYMGRYFYLRLTYNYY